MHFRDGRFGHRSRRQAACDDAHARRASGCVPGRQTSRNVLVLWDPGGLRCWSDGGLPDADYDCARIFYRHPGSCGAADEHGCWFSCGTPSNLPVDAFLLCAKVSHTRVFYCNLFRNPTATSQREFRNRTAELATRRPPRARYGTEAGIEESAPLYVVSNRTTAACDADDSCQATVG